MKKTRIQTRIQMYDKNMHTSVLKKHAYKCIKKTRIQMYDKNHVYKHAYKCMEKTRVQMYEKNTNTRKNV